MKKKTRLIILFTCVAIFLVVSPYIIMYSMGYRINFETWKVTETGGIYVRTFPAADQVIIDSTVFKKPGIFNNAVFVQDLLPKEHSVLIQKQGYFDYQKTLKIVVKEVSKIENIILFKNNIIFDELLKNSESFSISPDKKIIFAELFNTESLDFSHFEVSNPQNKKTYSLPLKYTSVLDVIWSGDSKKVLIKTQNKIGIAFYIFDFTKEIQQKTALSYLDATTKEISFNPQNSDEIFFIKNNSLFLFKDKKLITIIEKLIDYKIENGSIIWTSLTGVKNKSDIIGKTTSIIEKTPTNDLIEELKINYKTLQSPDGKNMIYYNNSEIYLYSFSEKTKENNIKLFSSNYPETISECFWLNNDYIIFQSGNKIIASEIDFRGNINSVEIPQTYPPSLESKTPKFIFNPSNSKIYILTSKTLYSSEKILP
jgi:hypothetical protein